ncbi:hypothetical protein FM076_25475 [Streptomyces albus subsp. chlorinus]|uniref:hypothetical protein n=1 Tax=Streptomyces albus TaxID=1888 RepID=UPI00156EDF4E|nr:hypothetical protein [Streptomyces albus]NSC24317.1 hypothetical protein [Streptomyces albus subsp. chlorinus]
MDKKDKNHIPGQRDPRRAPEKEGGRSGKKLDLSLAQVLGSSVAAVVAAFAAGQLGVYGTFLGAGVVSLVATSGGPIFQHFFSKTGEQLKEAAIPPKARHVPVRDPAAGWKDEEGGHTAQAAHNAGALHETQSTRPMPAARGDGPGSGATRRVPGTAPADDATRALSVEDITGGLRQRERDRPDDATTVLRIPDADATRTPPGDDATRMLGTVGRPTGATGPAALPGDGEFTEGTTHGTKWRGWRRTLLPAVVVFVIAIGGITLYEGVSGHSVSGSKGTSISHVFRPGHSSSGDEDPGTTPATPHPSRSDEGDSPSPAPDGSQPSTDPGDQGGDRTRQPGSGDGGDRSTPSPRPSHSQSDGTGDTPDSDSGESGSTPQESGGSEGRQDGDSANQGSGSGSKLPQGQQPGLAPQS